ncbi:MAG: transcriptional regulator BetI [Rhodobacteraceae bacterium]|nr:transcriptional regulator BetI [Paracoccaceae bacterium]
MPKVGVKPSRRAALVQATIAEIDEAGTLDVTVSQIARRAGMSSALAHHYFGSKDQMLVAAMRHILTIFGDEVRGALAMAHTPKARIEAIVRACFSAQNFRPEVVAAWLNFYVQAQTLDHPARRLLSVYHWCLHSNLRSGFRSLVDDPDLAAETIGSLIDGVYIRQALRNSALSQNDAIDLVLASVTRLVGTET